MKAQADATAQVGHNQLDLFQVKALLLRHGPGHRPHIEDVTVTSILVALDAGQAGQRLQLIDRYRVINQGGDPKVTRDFIGDGSAQVRGMLLLGLFQQRLHHGLIDEVGAGLDRRQQAAPGDNDIQLPWLEATILQEFPDPGHPHGELLPGQFEGSQFRMGMVELLLPDRFQ